MTTTPQPEPKPKLRWYQYSLASLFVLTAVAAIACSWFACKMQEANRRKEAVEAIWELGGSVAYDYEFDADGNLLPNPVPPGPAWFRNLVGVDFLADVVYIPLGYTEVSDAGLEHLRGMTKLKVLTLSGTQVTDAGLVHLQGLTNLQGLKLEGTQVTDAGLEHLQGLTRLKWLRLSDTQVTGDGVKRLQQALPNCWISR